MLQIAATAALACGGLVAGPVQAKTLSFGSTKGTPTLDTANGSLLNNGRQDGPQKAISPNPHAAVDLSVWNTSRGNAARTGGQVLSVQVKGCAIKDATAPSQLSQGTPVNELVFQALTRGAAGAWTGYGNPAQGPAGHPFELPFCSAMSNGTGARPNVASGAVSTSTVTTYRPLHMCISPGDVVALHTIGGFIPAVGGKGPWYAQGVPFVALAKGGGATASFVGFGSSYGPIPGTGQSGFGTESGQQLMLRVTMGTGGDAYGLCPGGKANEPATSNTVICTYGKADDGHKKCGAGGTAVIRRGGVFGPRLAFDTL